MSLEFKLSNALKSENKDKIESVFRQIYDSYFKLVYFCVSNYIKNKEDILVHFRGRYMTFKYELTYITCLYTKTQMSYVFCVYHHKFIYLYVKI